MSDNIFSELKKHDFVIIFEHDSDDVSKLEDSCIKTPVLLDLSKAVELKAPIVSHFRINQFPVLLYKSVPIYLNDNFQEKYDDINIKNIEKFVDEFVHKTKVAIFMKGTVEKPFCKFSKRLLALLSEINETDIGGFDIFSDEEMRYYLKIINNWNTYPMIYLNGKFIGGLDSFTNLVDTGEYKRLMF